MEQDALMKLARFTISFSGYDVEYERLELFTENGIQHIRLHLLNGHSITVVFNDQTHLDIPVDKSQMEEIKRLVEQPEPVPEVLWA